MGAGAAGGAGYCHAGRLAASGVQPLMAAARISILIAVMGAVGCGGSEPMPPVPPPQSTAAVAQRQVVGCYEHVFAHPLLAHTPPSGPPQRFLLTEDVLTTVPREGRIVTLWKVTQPESYRAEGVWRLIDDRMMEITWSNGFEGVRVRLQRGLVDELWRGWTEPYSDSGIAVSGARVSVQKAADAACRFR